MWNVWNVWNVWTTCLGPNTALLQDMIAPLAELAPEYTTNSILIDMLGSDLPECVLPALKAVHAMASCRASVHSFLSVGGGTLSSTSSGGGGGARGGGGVGSTLTSVFAQGVGGYGGRRRGVHTFEG